MKSKEEILNKYYGQGADGMPEISADSLLKAMEEYRLETEEAAFNAAREMQEQKFKHSSFTAYKAAIEVKPAEPTEADKIRFIADSIVEQFLPSDPGAQYFEFGFKTEGKEYTAHYRKNERGYWKFESFI